MKRLLVGLLGIVIIYKVVIIAAYHPGEPAAPTTGQPSPMVLPTPSTQYHPLAQALKQTFDSQEFRSNLKNVLVQQIKSLTLTPEQKEQAKRLLTLTKEGLSFNFAELQRQQQAYRQAVENAIKPFDEQFEKLMQQRTEQLKQKEEPAPVSQGGTIEPSESPESAQIKNIIQQIEKASESVPTPPLIQQYNAWMQKMFTEAQPFITSLTQVFGNGEQAMQYWATFAKEIVDALLQALQ